MSRRGRNIYHRADGRWEGRVVIGKTASGNTRYKHLYGKSCKEVREKMDNYRAELLINNDVRPSAGNFRKVSLSWLESLRTEIKEFTSRED